MPAEQLPEGTDAVVTGAGVDTHDEEANAYDQHASSLTTSTAPSDARSQDTATKPQTISSRIESLKSQAGDHARTFVEDAKARATDSIDSVVQLIHDAAGEVDDKVGSQYGDYLRRAADSVSGLSDGIKDRDVDALFADARDLVAKAPGVAIGVAAAIGFVVARLARAGVEGATSAETPKAA